MLQRVLAVCCAVLIGVCAGGCDDKEDKEAVSGRIPARVRVTDGNTAEVVPGVKVVVMDPATNLAVAGPVLSDADGICDFGPVRGERLRLLVFGGRDYAVREQQDWTTWWFKAAGPRSPVSPPDPLRMAPVPGPLPVVVARRILTGSRPYFTGIVVDAETDEPLAQAFLSLSPYPIAYEGGANPSDDVTGLDGSFLLYDIVLLNDGMGGPAFQIEPLRVTRQGYQPALFSYSTPFYEPFTDITDLVIPLQPLRGTDNGVLEVGSCAGVSPWPDAWSGSGSPIRWWTRVARV